MFGRRRSTWARDELAQLDPAVDYDRIARLVAEVRYGAPPIMAAFYTVTFVRQVGVPSIARILYRGGGGPAITDGRKRNDDTLVFFGELFINGAMSERGGATVERLQEIHGLFPITQDDYRYTLCTIIDEPARTARVLGYEALSPAEQTGWFGFWRSVGERMGIEAIPPTREAAIEHAAAYERQHWASTKDGRAVADAVIADFIARYLPAPLHPLGVRAFSALLGPELRAVHGYPDPGRMLERLVLGGLRSYLRLRHLMPDPAPRSVTASFGQEYSGACPHLADVGYRPPAASTAPSSRPRDEVAPAGPPA
jgi:ER-bound oxygenase mpaB/B'/Rubber oxygenase, catalytic domain